MATRGDPAEVYRSIGVKPIINASGPTTAFGGSKLRPEVKDAMNKVSGVMVNMDELNRAAGKVIAEVTGAEAGFVSSGAAGGLVLQAAAVMAGSDPIKMAQLPNTEGMKNEIIIQRCHRFPYDQCYRVAGAKLIDVGEGFRTAPWQMEAAFTDRTAAVAYLFASFTPPGALPFDQVVEMARAHDVPVLVDAASYTPPRAHLRRFISEGADMVIFSGGKQVRGPQGTGVLFGRADLIEAAFANASPHQFMGRGMKVAKEEIIGLIQALKIFVDEDEEAENKRYTEMCQKVVDALIEVPGIRATVEHDDHVYLMPVAVIRLARDWKGRNAPALNTALANGDPPIYLYPLSGPSELAVHPFNLDDDELEIVIGRLREELIADSS